MREQVFPPIQLSELDVDRTAEALPKDELVSFKELLLANSIQVDALAQLLIEEGLISQDKFITKLKQVQAQYQKRQPNV